MEFESTRFGKIQCDARDYVVFPEGVIGFEELKLWVILSDHALTWLQSVENDQVALPLTDPFAFVPEYQVRLTPDHHLRLAICPENKPLVMVVVNQVGQDWTLNLQAPILISPSKRLGWQVVTLDEQPLRYALPRTTVVLRKTA